MSGRSPPLYCTLTFFLKLSEMFNPSIQLQVKMFLLSIFAFKVFMCLDAGIIYIILSKCKRRREKQNALLVYLGNMYQGHLKEMTKKERNESQGRQMMTHKYSHSKQQSERTKRAAMYLVSIVLRILTIIQRKKAFESKNRRYTEISTR